MESKDLHLVVSSHLMKPPVAMREERRREPNRGEKTRRTGNQFAYGKQPINMRNQFNWCHVEQQEMEAMVPWEKNLRVANSPHVLRNNISFKKRCMTSRIECLGDA